MFISYKWRALSLLAIEGNLDGGRVACALVESVARVVGRNVQMKTYGGKRVASVFHAMQAESVC